MREDLHEGLSPVDSGAGNGDVLAPIAGGLDAGQGLKRVGKIRKFEQIRSVTGVVESWLLPGVRVIMFAVQVPHAL